MEWNVDCSWLIIVQSLSHYNLCYEHVRFATPARRKQMHSSMIFLPWAMTSDNAPFYLKIGEELGLVILSTFQMVDRDYVA